MPVNLKKDSLTIRVYGNDIDRAIRLLRRQVFAGGVFGILKMRREYPGKGDRRRRKDAVAKRKFLKRLKQKQVGR